MFIDKIKVRTHVGIAINASRVFCCSNIRLAYALVIIDYYDIMIMSVNRNNLKSLHILQTQYMLKIIFKPSNQSAYILLKYLNKLRLFKLSDNRSKFFVRYLYNSLRICILIILLLFIMLWV